jgi:hypothetical protein
MKKSDNLIKRLLNDTFEYYVRLERNIKLAYSSHILFHKKGEIKEAIVELNVNSLDSRAITTIRIPNRKSMIITE